MEHLGSDPTQKKTKVALLGCTGLVGQQFVRMLDGHPYFELSALTASPRSAGKTYGQAVAWSVSGEMPEFVRDRDVLPTSIGSVLDSGARLVFCALPSSAARQIEPELRRRGIFVFTNASGRRLDPDVPLLVPEINADHLALARRQVFEFGGAIITNSNCTTSGLVLVLKPLEALGLESVTVATYQAISGAGRRGLAAMDIAANVIPFIRDEEQKMTLEPKKILGRNEGGVIIPSDLAVNASCCRVPVRDGHFLSLRLDFSRERDIVEIEAALSSFRGVPQEWGLPSAPERPLIIRREEDRPQPILDAFAGSPARARGMAVSVGRIRKNGRSINAAAVVHNTIRGAAGGCLLNAETAFHLGIF